MKNQKQLTKLGEKLAKNSVINDRMKQRNLVALNPLLKKGGIHDKDNPKAHHKKQRKAAKLLLQKSY